MGWRAIHPKAQDFLFTERTFQQSTSSNALYAQALIEGGDLNTWHQAAEWRAKEDRGGKGAVRIFTALERSAARMAETAWETAKRSGKMSLSEKKDKQFLFTAKRDLEEYLIALLEDQEGLCALTGIEMLHDGVDGDPELRCSLDRIDSSGRYGQCNLQVVCKFANRRKCDSDNEEFKRLIAKLRE